jgi:nucleoside-diphosphate-sugar epimerase
MSQGTVLVTAATGDTGGATVEQLLARGRHVRALAHRKDARSERLQELGAEVVFGDFLDLDAIRAAVQGVRRAYFCYPIRPGIIQATAYFAQAAKESGIDGVVHTARAMYGEFEQKPEGRTGDSFLIQHLREAVIDLQNGILAGTNDVVKKIGGRQPTTLEEFIIKHRKAFA